MLLLREQQAHEKYKNDKTDKELLHSPSSLMTPMVGCGCRFISLGNDSHPGNVSDAEVGLSCALYAARAESMSYLVVSLV